MNQQDINQINRSSKLGFTRKIEKHAWKLLDKPGTLRAINKANLVVDDRYQREPNPDKVQRIAQAWSWMACGVILVANRKERFYVYDGWHRVLAAMSRSDISQLPCLVFETVQVTDEAQGFLLANNNRKPPNAIEKFKALKMLGDPAATTVQKLISDSNYEIVRSINPGRTVTCVGALLRWATREPVLLQKTWPLIIELAAGGPIKERVFEAVLYTESRITEKDMSLALAPWKARLLKLGTEGAEAAIFKATSFYSTGGPKVYAVGLLEVLNKGMRHKLTFEGVVYPTEAAL